jgi:hypothetical protein
MYACNLQNGLIGPGSATQLTGKPHGQAALTSPSPPDCIEMRFPSIRIGNEDDLPFSMTRICPYPKFILIFSIIIA